MATTAFGHIDDRKVTKQQRLIVFISGMGFFTDAYDLFSSCTSRTGRFANGSSARASRGSCSTSHTTATRSRAR
jgi:hypothetical protein